MWLGIGSLKGSPGVSTLAVVLAAIWPSSRRVLLVEADADGGDLATRFDLNPAEPGLLSLAAATRHGINEDDLWRNAQTIPGGVPVLVLPDEASSARLAITSLVSHLPQLAERSTSTDLIFDLGRIREEADQSALMDSLDLLVLAAKPTLESVDRVLNRLRTLPTATPMSVVLVGAGPYTTEEIGSALLQRSGGVAGLLGRVSDDPKGAQALNSGLGGSKRLRRSLLVRSTRTIADSVLGASGASAEASA
jgi:MinD-like ATPase involved in chromosome partitioning or flagellar assembly